MLKLCFHVSSISSFLSCLFVFSFFVNTLVSLPFPRSDQIEILMAFKNEFPILKCDFRKWPDSYQKTKSWTSKDVKSFDGVVFDDETGVVTKLDLRGACLSGSLSANSSLFRLHHLRYLDLSYNYVDSSSFLPELGKLTNLEVLALSHMGLAGVVTKLDLRGACLSANSSLFRLHHLRYLSLSHNYFDSSSFLPEFGNLTKLESLDLSHMGLAGEIPSSISSLNRLTNLYLYGNELIGSFSPLLNLSKLSYLDLSSNLFSGEVPCSLLTMPFLSSLDLSQNHLIDSLETMNCSSSSKLEDLSMLYLDNCSINEFPTFIKNLQNLEYLQMRNNRLKGEVPKWLWSMPSLMELYLSYNSFDSFEGSPKTLLSSSLYMLDLRSNAFRGSLPIFISPRLGVMIASNNSFTGDIPLSLCNQSYLGLLDLSHNNFSGSIPRCLINSSVESMNLRNNNLIGRLPDIFDKRDTLATLDVSYNQISGKLPRSLTNCTYLEVLNVEGNRIADTFPFWLKGLPNLKIIVLRSNKFHGSIYAPQHHLSFPQLRMVDISRNKFTGSLPHDYFVNLSKPLISIPQDEGNMMYMGDHYWNGYHPSMYLRNKGINMELKRIFVAYTSIDFSENKFGGQIPESISLLKSLIVLNLSSNDFTGHIPSSWANLTRLESLDLSRNQLSGKIPQELATLSFLEYVNVSHNKLTGQIPQGTQIGGQPKSSFEGNLNLCGPPLEESCFGDKAPSTPEAQEPEPPKQEQVLNWKAAAMGYGPGVLFGLAIGQVFYSYKPVLFYKLFRL